MNEPSAPLPPQEEQPWRWPDDYVSFDGGAMWVRPDCAADFKWRGWTTLDDVMNSDEVRVVRSREARDNCILKIDTDHGPVRGYLKRHRVRSRDDWRRERGSRRAADTPGMAEAEAVCWCRDAGVSTMSIIAAGQRKNPLCPRQSDSFFLSEDLSGCVPACDLWHDRLITDEARQRAIVAMAQTTRSLHQAKLFHYDLYLDHFFINLQQLADSEQPITARLMDLQRVERLSSSFAGWRAEVKDLGQFYGSCRYHGVTDAERQLWVQHYFGVADGTSHDVRRRDSAKLAAAVARWELRQWRRRVLARVQRSTA